MLPPEVLKQIRRLQLKARRAVDTSFGGEYHSIFKGTGIAFEELREYHPGDDIRSIDWNVTARTGIPFIKRFIEERELSILLVIDCSGSQQFGSRKQLKREIAGELAAVIAWSAISNNDRVALLQYTTETESFLPPAKGNRHVMRIIRDILYHQPKSKGTSLKGALETIHRVLHRRGIVFLLSDFADAGYEDAFRRVARRHDLISIRIADPMQEKLPATGLLQVEDIETGASLLLDTDNRGVRQKYQELAEADAGRIRRLAASMGTDLLEISTAGGHLDALSRFFRRRESRQKQGRL